MKRKTTTIIEEFDGDGKLTQRTTETTEEEDSGYIYPQQPYVPHYPYVPNHDFPWHIPPATCSFAAE